VFTWSAQTKTFSAFGNDGSLQEAVVAAFSLGGDEAVKDFVFAVERRVCRPIADGWYACPECDGSGEIFVGMHPELEEIIDYCPACRGDGDRCVSYVFVYRPRTQAWART